MGLCRAAPRMRLPSMATGSPRDCCAAQVRAARSSTSGSSSDEDLEERGRGGGGEAPQAMAVERAKGAKLVLGQSLGELCECSGAMVSGELRGQCNRQDGGQWVASPARVPELRHRAKTLPKASQPIGRPRCRVALASPPRPVVHGAKLLAGVSHQRIDQHLLGLAVGNPGQMVEHRRYSVDTATAYNDFTKRLKLLISKHPALITATLSNIFTMRLIGNKTHGDLAEIAISEFINQYMYDFRSIHVGKDLYRAKSQEEDIKITNEITKIEFPVSLKAYGDGPLQLSTDKTFSMFPLLERERNADGEIIGENRIKELLDNQVFSDFGDINILPLIYDEKSKRCNILVFDYGLARDSILRIVRKETGRGRKYPVYKFYGANDDYICEVRYGDAAANALQRGLWTHTKNGRKFFNSVTGGWIDYSHNVLLVSLFSHALVSSETGHIAALEEIKRNILQMKQQAGIA